MNSEDEKLAKESLEEGKPVSNDLPEAPASATIRFWAEGYGVMLTMRDEQVKEVVKKLEWVLEFVKDKGWKSSWKTEKEIGDTEEPIENTVDQVKQELPRTKVCEDCGGTRTYKTGVTKGRKWAGWFCNKDCEVEWVGTLK